MDRKAKISFKIRSSGRRNLSVHKHPYDILVKFEIKEATIKSLPRGKLLRNENYTWLSTNDRNGNGLIIEKRRG